LTENSWIVITDQNSGSLRDELKNGLINKGKMLIINVIGQGWGSYAISKEVTEWMKSKLK
jgi:hypothetical protein